MWTQNDVSNQEVGECLSFRPNWICILGEFGYWVNHLRMLCSYMWFGHLLYAMSTLFWCYLFWNVLTNGLCKSSYLYDLGRHYDSTPSLIGMASRAEKREKGEHMRRYYGHYPQCPIGAPELRVRGPGPTSIGAFKPMHAKMLSHKQFIK